jgi:hypothetical protein
LATPLFKRLIGRHLEFYVLLAQPGLGVQRAAHQSGYGAKRKNRFGFRLATGSCGCHARRGRFT